ncbi:MAG: type II toxin-antitoxin system Phd/YefM family antitoxin [Proteobacteria bacterium]|nr:type II toxin-antitoxin system Phd/YefM family antitoxin [Pseudomonadota bacterium]MBU1714841.1 type II toxin-antitoxin system Phd/YefM family antitoxin [Pseudomonadota bacterium]
MQTVENYIPITQAKSKLLDMVRSIHDRDDTFAITKNGIPEAVIISMKRFEGLLETIEILADQEAMSQFRDSVSDIKHGRIVDADEVL